MGFVDLDGHVVIPLRWQQCRWFSGGLAQVRIDNRWGYIDRTGKVIWEPTE